MAKKGSIASVLSFEKKLVPSDGFMYGTTWDKRNESASTQPLKLQEKSVRGTISNRLKAAIQKDPLKLNAEVEKPNLQRVDSCALGIEQDTLKLAFTLKVLSGVEHPSACNHAEFNMSYTTAVKSYIEKNGFNTLARRYAINIANGRFLWRNRVGVEQLEVVVKVSNEENAHWTFDALKIGTQDFEVVDESIDALASRIADTLSGKTDFLLLEVDAYAQVGKAQDVYPSEELVLDKGTGKGGKSKILYHINEIAGMHSQKIGNALRTIDTWYPAYGSPDTKSSAIAIEPYGAVTNLGIAFRNPKEKADFFSLFDKFALGEALEDDHEEHFVMAVLVRGGVFGESGKE